MIQFNQLPEEIQEKMLERQEEYKGKRDSEELQGSVLSGFIFAETKEGLKFWETVLYHGNIDHFYTLYPKKEKVIEGGWYKDTKYNHVLVKFNSLTDRNLNYGVNLGNNWTNSFGFTGLENKIPASQKEVEEMLIKECKRRGLVKGAEVRSLYGSERSIKTSNYDYDPSDGYLYSGDGVLLLFANGKFAEVLEEPKEQKGIYYGYTEALNRGITLAMILDKKSDSLHFGYSICNPSDEFNKNLGKQIAQGRATNERSRFTATGVGEDFFDSEDVMKFCLDQVLKNILDFPPLREKLNQIKNFNH